MKTVCTFKKGGVCEIHGTMGSKKTSKWKEWSKKRNGLYGYVNKQKTEYVCHFGGGATSNCGHQQTKSHCSGVAKSDLSNPGLEGTEIQTTALGRDYVHMKNTPFEGISGEVTDWTGRNMSERIQISSEQKDFD